VASERKPEHDTERLRCPFCGHEIERERHPSALYCGPHELSDGNYEKARRMRSVSSE
jgi:hypothetical protein